MLNKSNGYQNMHYFFSECIIYPSIHSFVYISIHSSIYHLSIYHLSIYLHVFVFLLSVRLSSVCISTYVLIFSIIHASYFNLLKSMDPEVLLHNVNQLLPFRKTLLLSYGFIFIVKVFRWKHQQLFVSFFRSDMFTLRLYINTFTMHQLTQMCNKSLWFQRT